MLGICFVFRLFYVAPETTARFSHFDDQSRSLPSDNVRSPDSWGIVRFPTCHDRYFKDDSRNPDVGHLSGPSPSAAGDGLSKAPPLPAAAPPRIRLDVPFGRPERPKGKPYVMTPVYQPVGLRLDGRRWCLGSERELRLGVCFWFRLFYVVPETTARFSHIDNQSRDHSPPGS
jgi:hypothetical protein